MKPISYSDYGLFYLKMKEKNTHYITVATFLNREQIDYLDKLGKDYFFKYGHKLSRTKILSELVNLLKNLNISLKDMDLDKQDLSSHILRLIKNEQKNKT
jgi:hypothetical protein